MAVNKAKVLQTADRLVEKGKVKKAISMYQRVVEADPDDVKSRLKMGDLQSRAGELPDALRTLNDVARRFEDDGNYLKSVAIYKRMLRLDDGLHSAHVALARVYNQLGLVNDAISQYQSAISVLASRKRQLDKLYVIRELLELDPDNVRARVRLAEDFLAEDKPDDGVRELRLAAETLDRQGCTDEFINVAERLLHHQPEDAVVSRRLASLLLDRGAPQEALVRLQACFRAYPQDSEVLDMLSRAFVQLGQSHKALTVLRELSRVHDRNGLVRDREDVLWRILELDPSDRMARKGLGQLDDELPGGSGEIAFEEADNAVPGGAPLPSRGSSVSSAAAAFDDLEALAELVASEPVSKPDIAMADLDSAPGLQPNQVQPVSPPGIPSAPAPVLEASEIGFGPDNSEIGFGESSAGASAPPLPGPAAPKPVARESPPPPPIPTSPPIRTSPPAVEEESEADFEVGFGGDDGGFLDFESLVDARPIADVEGVDYADVVDLDFAGMEIVEELIPDEEDATERMEAVPRPEPAPELAPLEAMSLDDLVLEAEALEDSGLQRSEAAEVLAIAEAATFDEVPFEELAIAEELSDIINTGELMILSEEGESSDTTEDEDPGAPTIQVSTLDEIEALLALDGLEERAADPTDDTFAPTLVVQTYTEPEDEPDPSPAADIAAAFAALPDGVSEDLEEVDFYIKNGMGDAAAALLDELPTDLQQHPEILARRRKL
ncbi:MAG: tetratricopeptide (TPR) repeat protein [Myxococcota bacterium]